MRESKEQAINYIIMRPTRFIGRYPNSFGLSGSGLMSNTGEKLRRFPKRAPQSPDSVIGVATKDIKAGELASVDTKVAKMPDVPVFWIRRRKQVDTWNPELACGDGAWFLVTEAGDNYVGITHDNGYVHVYLNEPESCNSFYGSLERLWDWSEDRKTWCNFYGDIVGRTISDIRTELIGNIADIPTKSHNPDNLTGEQVGVNDGWRLLDEDEIRDDCGVLGEIRVFVDDSWDSGCVGWDHSATYRTKLSREELRKARGLE